MPDTEELNPPVTVFSIYETEWPKSESFTSIISLVDHLKELRSEKTVSGKVQVLIFQGPQWKVSQGPFPYLLLPNGDRYPLFDESAVSRIEPDPDNFLATDQLEGVAPAPLREDEIELAEEVDDDNDEEDDRTKDPDSWGK